MDNIPDAHENNAGVCRQDLLWRGVDHFMEARGRQWFWCHCRPRPQRERVWAGAKGVIKCWRLVADLLMCSTSSSFRPLRRVSQIIWKLSITWPIIYEGAKPLKWEGGQLINYHTSKRYVCRLQTYVQCMSTHNICRVLTVCCKKIRDSLLFQKAHSPVAQGLQG